MRTTHLLSFAAALILLSACGNTTRLNREQRQAIKQNKYEAIESIVDSRSFTFNATAAAPMGGSNIQLTSRYYEVVFHGDSISANLPYYGNSQESSYDSEGGIAFTRQPDQYTVDKNDKRYRINIHFVIRESSNRIEGNLSVSHEGYASLTMESSRRSTVTYKGYISERIND